MNAMLAALFPVETGLLGSSRARPLSHSAQDIRAGEPAALTLCGIAAAVAAALPDFISKQPGHAILRPVLPILCGLSLVPRRGAGTFMSSCGLGTTLALMPLNLGRTGFGNVTSMLALGPALDLAMLYARGGWLLYVRCVAAGVAANLIAWVVRLSTRTNGTGSAEMKSRLMPYILWGAVAGLIGAAIWFRITERRAAISQSDSPSEPQR